jgi:hypothetical protein
VAWCSRSPVCSRQLVVTWSRSLADGAVLGGDEQEVVLVVAVVSLELRNLDRKLCKVVTIS